MSKSTIDALFYKNIKAFIPGHCFVCNQDCDPDSYCHYVCAEAITKEREKRCKEANDKALQQMKEMQEAKQ